MQGRIYLDNAATTALSPEVLREMMPYLTECYGNPSSVHSMGRETRRVIEQARGRVASAIGAQASEILFTSGGSESDNWAIQGAAIARREKGRHLITSAIEHHAVLHTMDWMEKQGFEVTRLPVDSMGRIDPEEVKNAIRPDTTLISIMAANNEVGTIQPIAEIGEIARERDILFHTDAVQAIGSVAVDVTQWKADLMSLSAHKFHGPKGTGALYIRRGTKLNPLIHGGAQERGMRAGTENVAGIVGMGAAIEKITGDLPERMRRVSRMREMLIQGIQEQIPDARLNGDPERRLPGNVHFSFPGVDGEALLLRLDLAGICCSGGSACTSGATEPSHVLAAMGQDREMARSGIRMTIGGENTEEEIREVLRVLPPIVRELRGMR